MKFIFITTLLSVLIFASFSTGAAPNTVNAQNNRPRDLVCEKVGHDCNVASDSTVHYITGVVTNVLTTIIASVSVLVLIIAGFMYILSAGKPETAKRAKNTILYALTGIVVAFFAQVIVRFVLSSV